MFRSRRPSTRRTGAAMAATATMLLVSGCGGAGGPGESASPATGVPAPTVLKVEVVARHPFNAAWFTQGLELAADGTLLVGTGRVGQSRLMRVAGWDGTPRVIDEFTLPPGQFGEGITAVGDRILQLTWRDGIAHRVSAAPFADDGIARYDGEGWGLCHWDPAGDGGAVIASDGSDVLTVRDPGDFAVRDDVPVVRPDESATGLNELECVTQADLPDEVQGLSGVWANRWMTGEIVLIDPGTGGVTAVADASSLFASLPEAARARADVLNGIAHVPGTDRFLLAGKLWTTLFEVRFRPAGATG